MSVNLFWVPGDTDTDGDTDGDGDGLRGANPGTKYLHRVVVA